MANPYEVLGVARGADPETIKRSFKRLAREYHPDRNPSEDAERRFKEITGAYDVLGDSSKRRLYDEFGDVAFQPGFDEDQARYWSKGTGSRRAGSNPYDYGHGFGMDDILGSLFGHDARTRASGRRGEDQTLDVDVDPVLAIRGGETRVQVNRPSGRSDSLTVRIPAGARDGGKLRLKGHGLPPPGGGPCGDLLLRLRIPEHPTIRRNGDDLEMDVPVTVLEAVLGARITVPSPTGDVPVNVPRGTTEKSRLRIAGRGVQRPSRPGDLYLVICPTLPSPDHPATIAAAQAMDEAYQGDVRAALKERLR